MATIVPALDMWKLTADQASRTARSLARTHLPRPPLPPRKSFGARWAVHTYVHTYKRNQQRRCTCVAFFSSFSCPELQCAFRQ
eukprot:4250818-Pleurochrysis_carterae.AAC.1